MRRLARGLTSTIGTKFLMALTGLILFVFVIGHMMGNLQVFLGQDALNSYASALKKMPLVLWLARLALLSTLVVHVVCSIRLTRLNRNARGLAYEDWRPLQSTLASRTMLLTGIVVVLFILYHLLHFTVGVTHPHHFALRDSLGRHDVHTMFIRGFREPVVALSYIVAMGFLGLHLWHGGTSFFQSMGWMKPRYRGLFRTIGRGLTVIVVAGNILMPLVILMGIYPGGGNLA